MNALREAQVQAFEAWKACPEKNRAEKARLAEALSKAAQAYNAKKRAQDAPTERAESLSALAAEANHRIAARESSNNLRRQVIKAAKMLSQANEWPRCGEDWPTGRAEVHAAALLRENPEMAEEIFGQE